MTVDEALRVLSPDVARAMLEHIGRVKHDLGKYVALQARWLGPEASAVQRLEALRQDLLETRRGPGGTQDAVSVWRALRRPLLGLETVGGEMVDLSDDPDVTAVEGAMRHIEDVLPLLGGQALQPAAVDAAMGHALACAEAVRSLHKRARHAQGEW